MLPSLPRQRKRLSQSRAPSIARCSQDSALAESGFLGNPPPLPSVLPPIGRLPTLFRLTPLSLREARLEDRLHRFFTEGRLEPRAACRLLLPNHGSRAQPQIFRTPRTTPAVARARSCFSIHSPKGAERSAGGRSENYSQPRFHGPGIDGRLPKRHLSPRSLDGESFAPTQSPRTPRVAAHAAVDWRPTACLDACDVLA